MYPESTFVSPAPWITSVPFGGTLLGGDSAAEGVAAGDPACPVASGDPGVCEEAAATGPLWSPPPVAARTATIPPAITRSAISTGAKGNRGCARCRPDGLSATPSPHGDALPAGDGLPAESSRHRHPRGVRPLGWI